MFAIRDALTEKFDAQKQKQRGPRGDVGEGTPGRRLKRSCPDGVSLKAYARSLDKMAEKHPRKIDAITWLASKRGR